jgi:hypothetical protein
MKTVVVPVKCQRCGQILEKIKAVVLTKHRQSGHYATQTLVSPEDADGRALLRSYLRQKRGSSLTPVYGSREAHLKFLSGLAPEDSGEPKAAPSERKTMIKKSLRRTSLLALSLLAGCETTYHPKSFTGGYSDSMLSPNVALVSFAGNGYTNPADVTKMALLRAAEVTTQHGYKFFSIATTQDTGTTMHVMIPGTATTTVISPTLATTSFTPGGPVGIHKPGITFTVQMANDQKSLAGLGIVYDAAYLQGSLRPQVVTPSTQQTK